MLDLFYPQPVRIRGRSRRVNLLDLDPPVAIAPAKPAEPAVPLTEEQSKRQAYLASEREKARLRRLAWTPEKKRARAEADRRRKERLRAERPPPPPPKAPRTLKEIAAAKKAANDRARRLRIKEADRARFV